jgi:hypothetical protein
VESLNYYKKVYPTPIRNRGRETKLRFKKSVRRISLGINLSSESHIHVGVENDAEDENFVKVIFNFHVIYNSSDILNE